MDPRLNPYAPGDQRANRSAHAGRQHESQVRKFQSLCADLPRQTALTCACVDRGAGAGDKTERTHRNQYSTRDAARADIFDYIERFYNPRRRHSTLGYLSPINYEKLAISG